MSHCIRRGVLLTVGGAFAAAMMATAADASENPNPGSPSQPTTSTRNVVRCFGAPIDLWVPYGGSAFHADDHLPGDSVIMGSAGDDTIYAGSGFDRICQPGGAHTTGLRLAPGFTGGVDYVYGEGGDDWVDGGLD